LFEPEEMKDVENTTSPSTGVVPAEPSLSAMTKKALEILQRSEKGYLLLVHSGRIGMRCFCFKLCSHLNLFFHQSLLTLVFSRYRYGTS